MKICWDNLENMWLTKKGNLLKKGKHIYIEMPSCAVCGESYLTRKETLSAFCDTSCCRYGENSPNYGRKLSLEQRRNLSEINKLKCVDKKNLPSYKGGVKEKGLPLFDTYAQQIEYAEETTFIYENDLKLLQVKCKYCGKWYVPTLNNVRQRIYALNMTPNDKKSHGTGYFYCSNGCRKACPTYGRIFQSKHYKLSTSREVQPELRQMVFKRDNWVCQYGYCGKTIEDTELHCHHIEGININPIESADIDMCITLCKEHHRKAHIEKGCRYIDMKCKEN
jgi:hypothetical protein